MGHVHCCSDVSRRCRASSEIRRGLSVDSRILTPTPTFLGLGGPRGVGVGVSFPAPWRGKLTPIPTPGTTESAGEVGVGVSLVVPSQGKAGVFLPVIRFRLPPRPL